MRKAAGMGAPNGEMSESWERMLSIEFGAFLLLHEQRHWARIIKERYPASRIELRHYHPRSMTLAPASLAEEVFGPDGYMSEMRQIGVIDWTPANELNLTHEGGDKTRASYVQQRDWCLAVAQECRKRAPWAILHFPALSPGNHEDLDEGGGYKGYDILRLAIDLYDVLDAHFYWFDDGRRSLDGDLSEWHAQRFRRVRNLFPDKLLAITEFNRQWNRDDPAERRRLAEEFKTYIRLLEAEPRILYACWFLWDSPDQGHHWATLNDQPEIVDALREFCKEESAVLDPYAGYRLTQDFGLTDFAKAHPEYYKNFGGIHPGRDYGMPVGTLIRAPASGTVIKTGGDGGYGQSVRLQDRQGYLHILAHLSSIKIGLAGRVERGAVVGFSGNTGLSSGPHLHWEVRENGKPIHPLEWVKKYREDDMSIGFEDRYRKWFGSAHVAVNPLAGIYQEVRKALLAGKRVGPPLTEEADDPIDGNLTTQFGVGWRATYNKTTRETKLEVD